KVRAALDWLFFKDGEGRHGGPTRLPRGRQTGLFAQIRAGKRDRQIGQQIAPQARPLPEAALVLGALPVEIDGVVAPCSSEPGREEPEQESIDLLRHSPP